VGSVASRSGKATRFSTNLLWASYGLVIGNKDGSGAFSGGLNVDATNEQAIIVLIDTKNVAHLDRSREESNRIIDRVK